MIGWLLLFPVPGWTLPTKPQCVEVTAPENTQQSKPRVVCSPFNKEPSLVGLVPLQRKTAAALQARLVDVLLSDNESLRRALSTVTREKAELCRALSQLERSPRASRALQESCTRRVRGRAGAGRGRAQTRLPARAHTCTRL